MQLHYWTGWRSRFAPGARPQQAMVLLQPSLAHSHPPSPGAHHHHHAHVFTSLDSLGQLSRTAPPQAAQCSTPPHTPPQYLLQTPGAAPPVKVGAARPFLAMGPTLLHAGRATGAPAVARGQEAVARPQQGSLELGQSTWVTGGTGRLLILGVRGKCGGVGRGGLLHLGAGSPLRLAATMRMLAGLVCPHHGLQLLGHH